MRRRLLQLLIRLLRRAGGDVTRVRPDSWLVQTGPGEPLSLTHVEKQTWLLHRGRRGPLLDGLDDGTWLLQRRGQPRLFPRHLWPPELRVHLLVNPRLLRGHAGTFQARTSDYLAQHHVAWVLRRLDINCVLDVGANVGQYAKRLRQSGYRGRIVSFEPVAQHVEELRAEAAGDPDWEVFGFALGEQDGSAQINAMPGTMSSLLPTSDFGRTWSVKLQHSDVETIQIRRLESVFDQAVAGLDDPRVFLKLDTQGFDLQALRGAGGRLEEVLGLQSEVACLPIYEGMARMPEQLQAYEAAGFETTGMFPVTRHHETMRVIEFDVVMVRSGSRR